MNLFTSNQKPLSSFETIRCASSASVSHFLSPLPPPEHREELFFKEVLIPPSLSSTIQVKTSGSSKPTLQKQWKYGQSYNYIAYTIAALKLMTPVFLFVCLFMLAHDIRAGCWWYGSRG